MTKLKSKIISQHKLRRYLELERAAKEYAAIKEEIIEMALEGLSCQQGKYCCQVDIVATTSVPWKKEFIRVADEDAADIVLENHKGNSERKTLVVIDRDKLVV